MKINSIHLIAILFAIVPVNLVKAQNFSASIPVPIDLTGANGSCAGVGAISVPVTVSGVGTMDNLTSISHIHLTFSDCAGSGSNMNNVDIFLMAPDGTCTGIYDGGFSTDEDETVDFTLISSNGCVNSPNTANMPQESGQNLGESGSSGVFAATYPSGTQIDLTTVFNGVNADGVWTIIFSESTSFEPCIDTVELTFGDPTVLDMTAFGDDCVNPITFDGSAICATTSGQNSSTQMPGWQGPGGNNFGTFSGGATCDWNASNDNDTWISFMADSTEACINISGLDNSIQSVVVTDPNTDGDGNPCTGSSGGEYWQLVSCPDPDIYTTTAGSDNNQNHCFPTVPGVVYYLVVDGNGGAESSFYVNGTGLTSPSLLSFKDISFNVNCRENKTTLNWSMRYETNSNYFEIGHSYDGEEFNTIGIVPAMGTSNFEQSYEFESHDVLHQSGYFRVTLVDMNGSKLSSSPVLVNCQNEIQIIPQENLLYYLGSGSDRIANCLIFDCTGRLVQSSEVVNSTSNLDVNVTGIYLVVLKDSNGNQINVRKIAIP